MHCVVPINRIHSASQIIAGLQNTLSLGLNQSLLKIYGSPLPSHIRNIFTLQMWFRMRRLRSCLAPASTGRQGARERSSPRLRVGDGPPACACAPWRPTRFCTTKGKSSRNLNQIKTSDTTVNSNGTISRALGSFCYHSETAISFSRRGGRGKPKNYWGCCTGRSKACQR